MRIGNRERIVIGVIAALAVIGGLHWFVFRERAREFEDARNQYNSLKSQLESQGNARAWDEIYRFQFRTINAERDLFEVFRDSRLPIPKEYIKGGETEEEKALFKRLQKENIWQQLERLQTRAANRDANPRLTFVEARVQAPSPFIEGRPVDQNDAFRWGLQSAPPPVVQRGADPGDLIRRLRDTDVVISQLPDNSDLLRQKETEYERMLTALGYNPEFKDFLEERFGETTGLLYHLSAVDQFKEILPKDTLLEQRERQISDEEFERRLSDLFRLEWPKSLLTVYKQIDALLDIVEIAEQNGIEEISYVDLVDMTLIKWPPPEKKKADETESQTDTSAASQEALLYEQYYGGGAGYPGAGGGYPGAGGYGPGALGAPAETGEKKDTVAASVPIEIEFSGTNSNVMAFLHDLTHKKRLYEVDALKMQSNPRREGQVIVRAYINVISHFAFPDFLLTEEGVQEKLAALETRKAEVAQKPGAKDLAEQEGYTPAANTTPNT
ncbi:MAG: hypothetical protein RLY93_17515 [Sumerlaeia bacterium]